VSDVQTQTRGQPYSIEQLVAEELGNSSYLVADPAAGDAVVIDPVRDVQQYLAKAGEHGWRIVCTLETHLHNDFLSGGAELAAAGHGRHMSPAADGGAARISGGDVVAVGSLQLRALHTPGHTPEHLSYLLETGSGPAALFSGGALMVGTIARPDLLGADRTFALARQAFATVRDVLAPMDDTLPVFPTHGGGSFCGAATSAERATTIGRERRDNALFDGHDFLPFLARYTNQGEFPRYYRAMAPMNRAGVPLLGVPLGSLRRVDPDEAGRLAHDGAALVDVRAHSEFDAGAAAGSLNAGVEGPMSAWVGWVLELDDPYVLVANSPDQARRAHRMLLRIGMDRASGWLDIAAWERAGRPLARTRRGAMADLADCVTAGEHLAVVDVRQEREWLAGHVPGAVHAMPAEVVDLARTLPPDTVTAVYCSTGYRSSLASSLLARDGRVRPWHITDGVEAWCRLGHPLTVPG
jgi:hydroxyacylglutathione hydrolase